MNKVEVADNVPSLGILFLRKAAPQAIGDLGTEDLHL